MDLRAAGIMFVHRGRVLLLKRAATSRDAPNTWGLPGGHIEAGETPSEAATRETREETGYRYDGELRKLLDYDGFRCFAARIHPDDDAFEPRLNHEHTAARWASFDKLPQPLHPMFSELTAMSKRANDKLIEGKSDKARSENIATEIRAGKDPKQAAAIAYSVQRKAGGKDAAHAMDASQVRHALDAVHHAADLCLKPATSARK